jgi:hypothetical protein
MLCHTNTQQDVYVAYKQRFEFLVRYEQTIFTIIGWWRVRKAYMIATSTISSSDIGEVLSVSVSELLSFATSVSISMSSSTMIGAWPSPLLVVINDDRCLAVATAH